MTDAFESRPSPRLVFGEGAVERLGEPQSDGAAAHDGEAELILRIRYENGGSSEITLDQLASTTLMESCQASSLEELQGHSWEKIREALRASYNRFQ